MLFVIITMPAGLRPKMAVANISDTGSLVSEQVVCSAVHLSYSPSYCQILAVFKPSIHPPIQDQHKQYIRTPSSFVWYDAHVFDGFRVAPGTTTGGNPKE